MEATLDDAMGAFGFPQYTTAEAATDGAVHLLALPAAIGAVGWLILKVPPENTAQAAALTIYGGGLIAMLMASAAYNLSRPCRRKEILRRVDRAMIFVMIAGTYTPFAVFAFQAIGGLSLCLAVWSMAAIGIVVTVAFPRRFERPLFVLYLAMGWIGLGMGPSLLLRLPTSVLLLLLIGGAAYTVGGAMVHSGRRFAFQNVVWHILVVLGAGFHWAAMLQLLPKLGPPFAST